MRIGIDCRLGGSRHAGIGRYIENLLLRLPSLDSETTWVYFYHDEEQKQAWLSRLATVTNVEWVKAPVRHYTLSEQLKMPRYFSAANLDLLHVPHFNIPVLYPGRLVITIHDLLWHEYYGTQVTTLPSWQYWFKYVVYRWITQLAVVRANRIFVPAETIKLTLKKYFPHQAHKVVVTTEGADGIFSAKSHATMKPKRQLVYIGSLYPHKNIKIVIKALKKLPDYRLILVGARSVFQDQTRLLVKQVGVSDQVEFAGYLPDEAVSTLLHESLAVVQPSLSEGFGLTGVEAMAAGVPVLASDIPIFNEIYQEGAVFFDPFSADSFIQAVHALEQTDNQRRVMAGRRVAQSYSWDTMAEKTLQAYRDVLS